MNENSLKKLCRILVIVTAALVALCGIAYAVSAIHLYSTGGATPYAKERVSAYLLYLLPISILTVLSVIGSGILSVMTAEGERKLRGAADKRDILAKLYRRYRISAIDSRAIGGGDMAIVTDPESYGAIARERRLRKLARGIFAAVCTVFIAVALVFVLNPARYDPSEYNSTVVELVLFALAPCAAIVGGYFILSLILTKSYGTELALVKAQVASSSPKEAPLSKPDGSKNTQKLYTGIRIAVLTVAVALIVTGIAVGDVKDIIDKAIRICQECIGIG